MMLFPDSLRLWIFVGLRTCNDICLAKQILPFLLCLQCFIYRFHGVSLFAAWLPLPYVWTPKFQHRRHWRGSGRDRRWWSRAVAQIQITPEHCDRSDGAMIPNFCTDKVTIGEYTRTQLQRRKKKETKINMINKCISPNNNDDVIICSNDDDEGVWYIIIY